MSATRYVAVVRPPQGPLRFCAHIHRRRDNAELCARRCALRLPGATAEVAEAWDPQTAPCVTFQSPGEEMEAQMEEPKVNKDVVVSDSLKRVLSLLSLADRDGRQGESESWKLKAILAEIVGEDPVERFRRELTLERKYQESQAREYQRQVEASGSQESPSAEPATAAQPQVSETEIASRLAAREEKVARIKKLASDLSELAGRGADDPGFLCADHIIAFLTRNS